MPKFFKSPSVVLSQRKFKGYQFEAEVLRFLEQQGYRLLLKNERILGVEIDLLLESHDRREVFLVEVKLRSDARRFDGAIVSPLQYRRLLRALAKIRGIYPRRQVSWAIAYRNTCGEIEFVANPCYF